MQVPNVIGIQNVIRFLIQNFCIGLVNGQWGDWINSSCSVTCGSGKMTSTRSCDSPLPAYGGSSCTGVSAEIVACKFDDCIGKCVIYLDACL
jgi:hypothetical protein